MDQISWLSTCRIRQIEDEFDNMEQSGQVKNGWNHLEGFEKMDPCKRTKNLVKTLHKTRPVRRIWENWIRILEILQRGCES